MILYREGSYPGPADPGEQHQQSAVASGGLLLPGQFEEPAKTLIIIGSHGQELEVPVDDLWAYEPDASGGSLSFTNEGEI